MGVVTLNRRWIVDPNGIYPAPEYWQKMEVLGCQPPFEFFQHYLAMYTMAKEANEGRLIQCGCAIE